MQRLEVGGWVLSDGEALEVVRCVVAGLRSRDSGVGREFAGRVLARVNGHGDADRGLSRRVGGRGGDVAATGAGSWLGTREAADAVEVSVRTVRRLAAGGKVEARRDPVTGCWLVGAGSLAVWAAGRREV